MKELYLIGDPKFSNPFKGIAQHPLYGMGHIRNVDILTNPGCFRLNNLTTKQSASTVTGQIQWQRINPTDGKVYAIDDGGKVYTATNLGATWTVIAGNSGGTGGGLEIWKDYLLTIGTTGVDAYGPLSSSPSWHNNFSGSLDFTQSQQFSPMLRSIDDSIYIGNGKYVSRLQELTTFDPTSAPTFTFTAHAITLATNYQVITLRDLGSNLMIGTRFLNSSTLADIFPYARTTLTLGIPIRIVENGVRAMYNLGNRLYVIAGTSGRMFITDTVSASEIPQAKIPNYLISFDAGGGLVTFPDAIMYHKGKLYFGVSNSTLGNAGVWSFNPVTKALQMENIISTGNDGSSNALYISSLQPLSIDAYLLAWRDNATYGVDLIDDTKRYTGYLGYVDSPLVKIGDALDNKTTPQLEVNLVKPLVSGQGVKIQYRKDLISSFADLPGGPYDFATYGGFQSSNFSAGVMTNLVYVQIRCLLTTASNSNLSPEVQSILLKNQT